MYEGDARVISTHRRKARKVHHCELCWTDIEKGQVYSSQSLVMDGSAYTFKSHTGCHALCEHVCCLIGGCEGFDSEDFDTVIEMSWVDLWTYFDTALKSTVSPDEVKRLQQVWMTRQDNKDNLKGWIPSQ